MTADIVLHRFAGAGGWEEGARLAGYAGMQVGIELDPDACRTAAAAGHARVRADVTQFPLARLVGKVLGCVESPPCPTWSTAGDGAGKIDLPNVVRLIDDHAAGREPGRYEWADPRSALTAEPMRSVRTLRPRFVALEQVPPVLAIWRYMAHKLRGLGYQVWTGVLSAEEYGVPQTRKRAILIARLDGPAMPPRPTHQPYRAGRETQDEDDMLGSPLLGPVSMAEALGWGTDRPSWTVTAGHDPFANADVRAQLRDAVAMRNGNQDNACTRYLDEPAGTVAFGHAANSVVWMRSNYGTGGDPTNRGERRADEPASTVTGKIKGAQWRMHPAGLTGSYGYSRPVDDPSPTIKGAGSGGQYVSDGEVVVRVSIEEAGVLQSFRADYPWSGTSTRRYLQVGNAVPPLLAAAILRPLFATDSLEVAS